MICLDSISQSFGNMIVRHLAAAQVSDDHHSTQCHVGRLCPVLGGFLLSIGFKSFPTRIIIPIFYMASPTKSGYTSSCSGIQ